MLKLKECIDRSEIWKNFDLRYTNVDEIFLEIREKGITDISVDAREMSIICIFICGYADKENAYRIITTGNVDKFMGINLHLNA